MSSPDIETGLRSAEDIFADPAYEGLDEIPVTFPRGTVSYHRQLGGREVTITTRGTLYIEHHSEEIGPVVRLSVPREGGVIIGTEKLGEVFLPMVPAYKQTE